MLFNQPVVGIDISNTYDDITEMCHQLDIIFGSVYEWGAPLYGHCNVGRTMIHQRMEWGSLFSDKPEYWELDAET
jgi:hypothetical protein